MRTQTVALVDGTPDILASLESLFEGGGYDVVFPTLPPDAYVEIKRLRPQRVVLCTALEDGDALQLLTMLRLDRATRHIPVVAVTPHGECNFGGQPAMDGVLYDEPSIAIDEGGDAMRLTSDVS